MSRDEFAKRLRERGVDTRTFFCPMNQQPFLKQQEGYREIPCPVADRLWERGLYLPSTHSLDVETIRRVAEVVRGIQSDEAER